MSRHDGAGKRQTVSSDLFEHLLEQLDEGVFVTDRDDRILFVNEPMAKIAGVPKEQILGVAVLGGFPEETLRHFRPHYLAARDTARPVSFDAIPVVTPTGRMTYQSGKVVPLLNHGHYDGLICTLRDVTGHRSAEEALRESESRYRLITERMTDVVWMSDMDLRTVYVSPSVEKVLGFTPPERMRQPVEEQLTPESLAFGLEALARELALEEQGLADPGRKATLVLEYYRKDGSTVWMETVMSGIRNKRGELTGLHGVSRDVTDRKLAEDALRKSGEYFRQITENASDILFIVDDRGIITYVTPSVERIVGYRPEELTGRSVFDLFVPDELPRALEKFGLALQTRDVAIPDAFRIRHRDGSERVMEGVGKNLMHNPAIAGFVTTVRDVTDQRRAEESLRQSEENYRLLFETAGEGVMIVQGDRIRLANPALVKILGYPEDRITTQSFVGFIHPADAAMVYDRHVRRMRGEDVETGYSFRIVTSDGTEKWLEIHSQHVTWEGAPASLSFVTDITERKRLEERLARVEKMEALGTLAGGVAHDLNNVLGVLVGYSELLAEKLPEGGQTRRYADNILRSGIKGAAIIQDLLTLARRGVAVEEVVDLNRIVRDYLKTPEFENLFFQHRGVLVRHELDTGLLSIKGSPVHLGKTVMNLVSNAVEAISGDGVVTIRTENLYLDQPIHGYDDLQEGDYVLLTVTDTGRGIAVRDIGKIFEPFYTSKVMGRSGTGLGLAVVWGTVKDHRGYIDVRSEEGAGTTFTLYFPVTREEPAAAAAPPAIDAYAGRGENILVVDDVREQRELAVSMLGRLGYRAEAVSSGEEAVAYLRRREADLVVLDMIMPPGIDGLETYRLILEFRPGQKAVIVSGFSETERVREALELGAGAFVRKPYIMEKIGLAVREEMDR